MQTASQLLPAEITVREALEWVRSSKLRTWLVTDRRAVVGVINLSKLERELAEGADKKLGELVDALVFRHVHPDQELDLALERMGANQIEILPVVNRADVHKLEGVVPCAMFWIHTVSADLIGLRLSTSLGKPNRKSFQSSQYKFLPPLQRIQRSGEPRIRNSSKKCADGGLPFEPSQWCTEAVMVLHIRRTDGDWARVRGPTCSDFQTTGRRGWQMR